MDMSKIVKSLEAIGYEVRINPDWHEGEHSLMIKRKKCDKSTVVLLGKNKKAPLSRWSFGDEP
jgi:hypothetical protein